MTPRWRNDLRGVRQGVRQLGCTQVNSPRSLFPIPLGSKPFPCFRCTPAHMAERNHNPRVGGSSPSSATRKAPLNGAFSTPSCTTSTWGSGGGLGNSGLRPPCWAILGRTRITQAEWNRRAAAAGREWLEEIQSSRTPTPARCLPCGHAWSPWPANVEQGHGCPGCPSNHRRVSTLAPWLSLPP